MGLSVAPHTRSTKRQRILGDHDLCQPLRQRVRRPPACPGRPRP
ncbi:hypothetical protein LG3211_0327 [Lysobacter gummosus]|nr:hypothetical protein LG3211_0327 [Lysobacter gummosus]